MPNHTDCRMFLVGERDRLDATLVRMGAYREDMLETDLPQGRTEREIRDFWGQAFQTSDFFGGGLQNPIEESLGIQRSLPFTLQVGSPRPKSLDIDASSMVDMGMDILEGNWRKILEHPHWRARMGETPPGTREEMIEWAQKEDPKMIRQARMGIENLKNYGCKDWYEWSVRNWGTKWDAYDVDWKSAKSSSGMLRVNFQTAWSPPLPALVALCEKMKIAAVIGYVDEGGGFSDYSILRGDAPDGFEMAEDVGGGLTGRELWRAVREAAEEIVADLAPAQRKGTLPGWARKLLAGKEPPSSLRSAGDSLGEINPADLFLASMAKEIGHTEESLLKWLDWLERGNVLKADAKTSQGKAVAMAFAEQAWAEGIRWACERVGASEAEGIRMAGLAVALRNNVPEAALACFDGLSPELRPLGKELDLAGRAPQAISRLLDSDNMEPEQAKEIFDLAWRKEKEIQGRFSGAREEELSKCFDELREKFARREASLIGKKSAPSEAPKRGGKGAI